MIYDAKRMTDAVTILKDALRDIGKNIVRSMLEANGFDVLDLGVDCPAENAVETAKAENIRIAVLSGVLTLALDSMKATVDAIKAAGIDFMVIIGGPPSPGKVGRQIGIMQHAPHFRTYIGYRN